MAEGSWEREKESSFLPPPEDGFLREVDEQGDADQQLVIEKELAAQRLWQSFQESATAVAYLFKDVQERGGGSFWIPFHESASAVTQLYRGSAEVCRQCVDSGVRYGQRKKNRELIAWAKKKRRHIKREELLAYLMDKPDPPSVPQGADNLMEEGAREHSPMAATSLSACFGSGSSPRRRVVCRDESNMGADCEVFSSPRELPRKRQQPNQFSFDPSLMLECPPFAKRIRF